MVNIKDLSVSSPAFEQRGEIPSRYTRDGGDLRPPLEWHGVPADAESLALICHDPDAPLPWGFTHWVAYGIPTDATQLDEGTDHPFTAGTADNGSTQYAGPNPPPGHGPHHYYFWLYALDTEVTEPGLTRREFLDQYGENIIEQNRLVGVYERT